ncbi:hypothetical protein Vretimale_5409 [Volvox reticuliferus]|uniref:Uncharacterized protein n=1 Tax=Volvox reticuliferus TaxID=1737510 RepID=A0A8J4G5A4_9CHLO|nr:hypothetical protein Vretimale_5409 [Volvox reticuliferus]
MAAKDRAILQLEEVLVLKQQAIDRMLEASTHAAETDLLLQERTAQVNALEKVLGDARGKISSLKTTVTEQKRQLEVANEQLQHRAMDDMRVDQLRKQLTAAFQEELRIAQQRGEMHEQLARGLSADVQRLKELLAQRDKDIQALNDQGTRSKLQIQRLQQELMRPSGGASIDATRGLSTMQTALGEPWREDSRLTMLSDELGGHGRRRPTASTGVAQEDSDMERMYAELDELRRQRQAHVFRRHESAATVPSAPVPVPASPPKINPASPHHTQPALQPMLHPQQLQHEQQQALLEQHAQLHEAAISALKVQVETLNQQLTTVAAKLQVRDAQAKKYKEAVKVLKAQLHTSENALSDRQAKFMELHLELSALNRMLKDAPTPAPALSPQDAAATVAAAAATAAVAEASAEEAAARAAAEIASMSADIASLKQQLVDKDTSIAALRREVADREALRLEAVERAMDAVRRAGAAEEAVAHAAEQLREGLDKVVALETNQQAAVAAAAEAARLNAQLREAQEKIATLEAQQQAAAAATAAAATAAVAAAQQAAARVAEAETVPRRLGDAEAQARDAEARLSDALRQADQAKARQLEAQKRVDESARQLAILEARLDEAERKLADYRRVIERAEQRAERAERCAREAEIQLAEADRRASQAESYANTMERRLRDTEAKVLEVDRHAKEVEARGMELEARLKATETRALEFEKRGLDCESRLAVSERRVRDAESQITELTHRWRETERQKQEADIQARAAEASAKQVRHRPRVKRKARSYPLRGPWRRDVARSSASFKTCRACSNG